MKYFITDILLPFKSIQNLNYHPISDNYFFEKFTQLFECSNHFLTQLRCSNQLFGNLEFLIVLASLYYRRDYSLKIDLPLV